MRPKDAAIGLVLGVMALGTVWSTFTMHALLGELRGLAATRDHNLRLTEPARIEVMDMSKITRTKTVNGETISLTCCQQEGESYRAFLARCAAEWEALCEALGG